MIVRTLLLLALGTACGRGATAGGASPPSPAAPAGGSQATARRGSANLIVEAELIATQSPNVLEAIQKLRPAMLRGRGATSFRNPTEGRPEVFLDNAHYGGVAVLANIAVAMVKEVRYFSAAEATTRWGTGYPSGVILVISKTGR